MEKMSGFQEGTTCSSGQAGESTQRQMEEKLLEILRTGESDEIKVKKIIKLLSLDDYTITVGKVSEFSKSSHFACKLIRKPNLILLACKENDLELFSNLVEKSQILRLLASFGHSSHATDNWKEALNQALKAQNIELIDKLYSYWSSGAQLSTFDPYLVQQAKISHLKQLKLLLEQGFDLFSPVCTELPTELANQVLVHIHGLIQFSSFLIALYKKLRPLQLADSTLTLDDDKKDKNKYKFNRDMFLTVINVHKEYSDEFKVRLKKFEPALEAAFGARAEDTTTLYWKYFITVMYGAYFRRLDYTVSTLILENLHFMQHDPVLSGNAVYKEIESVLYMYVSDLYEGWVRYKAKPDERRFTKDFQKLVHSSLSYLARREFQNCLDKLSNALDSKAPVAGSTTVDQNCLNYIPFIRDELSLRKILQAVQTLLLSTTDGSANVLESFALERCLQIIGEFLKGTEDSLHLEPSTEALLHTEIPFEMTKMLKNLRDSLSHVDKGQLLARIEIENCGGEILSRVNVDLQHFKSAIEKTLQLHVARCLKWQCRRGINLLHQRESEILGQGEDQNSAEVDAYTIRDIIRSEYEGAFDAFLDLPKLLEQNKSLMQQNCSMSDKLVDEFVLVNYGIQELRANIASYDNRVFDSAKDKLSMYLSKIHETSKELKSVLGKESGFEKGSTNLQSIVPRWLFVKGLLKYLLEEVEILHSHHWQIENGYYTNILKNAGENPSKKGIKSIGRILSAIQESYKGSTFLNSIVNRETHQAHDFQGLKKLATVLTKPNFVTSKEKTIILNSIPTSNNKKHVVDAKSRLVRYYNGESHLDEETYMNDIDILIAKNEVKKILKSGYGDTESFKECIDYVESSPDPYNILCLYLESNDVIKVADYKKICESLDLNDFSKKILSNGVLGSKRCPNYLECLNNRLGHLYQVLLSDENLVESSTSILDKELEMKLVFRFKHDLRFKAVVELLLTDVLNIMKESPLRKQSTKTDGLLAGANLRNVLEHGNPLLEDLGNILDPSDLPTKFISEALTFVRDKDSVSALYELTNGGYADMVVKAIRAGNELERLTAKHQSLVSKFKMSKAWLDYLKLVETNDTNCQVSVKAGNGVTGRLLSGGIENELHQAVKHRHASRQQIENIIERGVDLNCFDKSQRTALHYATINGSYEIVSLLLSAGASAGFKDKHGKSAIFYAHSKKFVDIQHLLARNLTVELGRCLFHFLREHLPE